MKNLMITTFLFLPVLSQAQTIELPAEFRSLYSVSPSGGLVPRTQTRPPRYTFNNPKPVLQTEGSSYRLFKPSEDTTSWSVGSGPCPQNRQYSCTAVYNRESTRIRGNSSNPWNDSVHNGEFTIYKANKDTQALSSVVTCDSHLTMSLTWRTTGSAVLKDCSEFTPAKCVEWQSFLKSENSLAVGPSAETIRKTRAKMDVLFRVEDSALKKEIEESFFRSANGESSYKMTSVFDVEKRDPASPSTVYQYQAELSDKEKKCAQVSSPGPARLTLPSVGQLSPLPGGGAELPARRRGSVPIVK